MSSGISGPALYDYNKPSYDQYQRGPTIISNLQNTGQYYQTTSGQPGDPSFGGRGGYQQIPPQFRNGNYNTYAKRLDHYRYNIFSFMDEPWNRCCEVGRCGGCPDNQCVATRTPKMDWI